MSGTTSGQGPGWWLASDGKWYPPESAPGVLPPPPLAQPAYTSPGYGAPYQGAPYPGAPGAAPVKKGHGCLYAFLAVLGLGVIAVVIVVVVAATASKKIADNIAKAGTIAGPAPAAQYTVGQTASSGGFKFTVYAVKDPMAAPNSFATPTAGDHFVSVDVQVTNTGSSAEAFSSLLLLHLLDGDNRQYTEDIAAGVQPSSPDGEIAAGQSVRGFAVFEVPDGTTGLKFRAQGGLTAAGAVFSL